MPEGAALQLRVRADKSGPEPPRNLPDEEGNLADPSKAPGALLEPWPVAGLEVTGDPPPTHEFHKDWIIEPMAAGWLSLTRGTITLHTVDGDLVYKILSYPGSYDVEGNSVAPDDPRKVRTQDYYACELQPAEGD